MKWNESGFRPPLCTYRLNWARRTSWGWWDDWDDTVLQTQDSKFEPWRSEAEHATSWSRRLPTILTFTRGWGRNIICFFQTACWVMVFWRYKFFWQHSRFSWAAILYIADCRPRWLRLKAVSRQADWWRVTSKITFSIFFFIDSSRWPIWTDNEMEWYEWGFRPPLCTYRINRAMMTFWGWWDEWADSALQTQELKFEPWRFETEPASSLSRRFSTILNLYEWAEKKHFVSLKLEDQSGARTRDLRLSCLLGYNVI